MAGRRVEAEQGYQTGHRAGGETDGSPKLGTSCPGLWPPVPTLGFAIHNWPSGSRRRPSSRTPEAGSYWNTLGVAHYRAGDWKAAIEALEKSTQLRAGGDPSVWFFLAMAHWQKGEKDQARQWYDKAVNRMERTSRRMKSCAAFAPRPRPCWA